ncbi:MAG: 50S ribosomal protein L10 [Tepidisphaeraceae bacterium]|jgi:large subunit ribosomal protein L10
MSKKVKNLITKELVTKFKPLDGVAVISPRGIDGIKNNLLRRRLREKGLRMTVVKNSLARRATEGTKLSGFDKLLEGPSAVIHGQVSIANIARLLLEEKKKDDKLEIRGLFFDGELYTGEKGIKTASELPTREEAVANLLGMILGPGRKLAGAIKGPGGRLGAVLKTIEEKAKEKEGAAAPAASA